MICGYISLKAEGIVCCHGYLIHRFTSDHRTGLKLHCLLFFSYGSSECIKIQNQRLYEIGGNIGKHSLTVFTPKFSDYSKRNMMLLL